MSNYSYLTHVGDITDTKTDYDRGEQLCLAMNQIFTALGRPKEFEAQAQAIWKEYESAKAGFWWTATEKWLNATKMKNAGIDASKLTEDMKRAYPAKMAGKDMTNIPPPSKNTLGQFATIIPWWVWAILAGGSLFALAPTVITQFGKRYITRLAR